MAAAVSKAVIFGLLATCFTSASDTHDEIAMVAGESTLVEMISSAPECSKPHALVDLGCINTKIFQSPSNNDKYKSNLNCGWVFTSGQNCRLRIKCSYISIKEGDSFTLRDVQNDALYNTYSAVFNVVLDHYFDSREVRVTLRTDEFQNAKGFSCEMTTY